MRRNRVISAALGGILLLTPYTVPVVLADDDNLSNTPSQDDPSLTSPTVQGIVYGIKEKDGAQVVTILDTTVTNGGLGIDVFVRDTTLVKLVKNGSVCVGGYITATGIRTGVGTLDAQGIMVDPTHACGTPPK